MKSGYKITRDKFFDAEERKAILKTCEEKAIVDLAKGRKTWPVRWMLVHLAMYSGLRVSEIAALTIGDIHLSVQDPYLFVRQGKRGKSRDVYIDRELAKHLKRFIIKLKRNWDESTDPDTPLFAGRGGKQISTTALEISFKQAVREAGLRNDLSIHSARHTYATFLYANTRDLRAVQKQLGHSHINMTSLYADILPQENGTIANKILDE